MQDVVNGKPKNDRVDGGDRHDWLSRDRRLEPPIPHVRCQFFLGSLGKMQNEAVDSACR